jgi:hypothetical protein
VKETTRALIRWYLEQSKVHAGTDEAKSYKYFDKAQVLMIKENQKNSGGATVCGEPGTGVSPQPILKNSGRCVEGLKDLVTRVTNRQSIAPAPVIESPGSSYLGDLP